MHRPKYRARKDHPTLGVPRRVVQSAGVGWDEPERLRLDELNTENQLAELQNRPIAQDMGNVWLKFDPVEPRAI